MFHVLTVVLLVLKAFHVISIAWWMCFIPSIVVVGISVAMLALVGVLALLAAWVAQ